MKLISKITFIVLANLIWVIPGFSQSLALKLNLPGIAIGQYSVGVEVPITSGISLSVWAAGLPSSTPSLISDNLELENAGIDADIEVSGVVITPEVRFYFSGEAPRGFYLGLYGQYYSYSIAAPYAETFTASDFDVPQGTVSPDETVNVDADATGFANNLGGGITIGNQFVIADIIALDLFFGVGVGGYDLAVRTNNVTTDRPELQPYITEVYEEIAESLNDEIDDLSVLGSEFESYSSSREAGLKGNGLAPTFRLGIALGIAL